MDRQPIFPGKSCFPLSPDIRTNKRRAGFPSSETDQIKLIFDVIGTPKAEDTDFISDPKALQYVRAFAERDPINFSTMYPSSPPEAIDLLKKLLTFNPNKRITLDEVEANPFLERVRDPARELIAEIPQNFAWDLDPNITIMKLREHFLSLVASFQALK